MKIKEIVKEMGSMGASTSGGFATVSGSMNEKPIKRIPEAGEYDYKAEQAAWQEWIKSFNSDVERASKSQTIMGQPFETFDWVEPSSYDDTVHPTAIKFNYGGKEFHVLFTDHYAGGKPGLGIELSAEGHNGRVNPVKVTGKNANITNIIKRVENLFNKGRY